MSVRELIELLQALPSAAQEAQVVVAVHVGEDLACGTNLQLEYVPDGTLIIEAEEE
jgi:hypothetical protein